MKKRFHPFLSGRIASRYRATKKNLIVSLIRWLAGLHEVTGLDLTGLPKTIDRTLWAACEREHNPAWGGTKGGPDASYRQWVKRHNHRVADELGFIVTKEGGLL